MTQPYACFDAAFLSSVDGIGALPHLLRLLARGEPVDLGQLVEVGGKAGADLGQVVRAQPGAEWDRDGRLVGFGLTARPTEYRFLVADTTLYTWCASDTLFFTVILGRRTVAESTCPKTGEQIRLELTPESVTSVRPSGGVVSQRHRQDLVANLRSDICDHGHFFSSPHAAAEWLAAYPEGQVLSIAEAFAECRDACEELGWLTPAGAEPVSALPHDDENRSTGLTTRPRRGCALVAPPAELRISILHVPHCPSVSRVRAEAEAALDHLGVTAVIEEIEGAFPSPTVLIDGVEVDGYSLGPDAACRVGIPTSEEIAAAVLAVGVRCAHSGRP